MQNTGYIFTVLAFWMMQHKELCGLSEFCLSGVMNDILVKPELRAGIIGLHWKADDGGGASRLKDYLQELAKRSNLNRGREWDANRNQANEVFIVKFV